MIGAISQVSRELDEGAPVEALLEEGLDLYGQNRVAEAVHCWRRVLALVPDEPRAREYLDCAGVGAEPEPPPSQDGPATLGSLALLRREGRHEEVLELLYAARARAPGDASLTREIKAVKEALITRYAQALGSLDRIPVLLGGEATQARAGAEERQVLRLIDGLASFGDVLGSSRLGRFETYRLLCAMLRRGLIAGRTPSTVVPGVSMQETDPAPSTKPGAAPPVSAAPMSPPPMSPPPASPPPASALPASALPVSAPATRPAANPVGEAWEVLFARATEAYLGRDYDEATRLYEECLALRPGEWRAENNLRKLRQRRA